MHKEVELGDVPVRILDDLCANFLVVLDYDMPPTGRDRTDAESCGQGAYCTSKERANCRYEPPFAVNKQLSENLVLDFLWLRAFHERYSLHFQLRPVSVPRGCGQTDH